MGNEQALAYARHELEYYKQVKRDGIAMTTSLEFWSIVVDALEDKVARLRNEGREWRYRKQRRIKGRAK